MSWLRDYVAEGLLPEAIELFDEVEENGIQPNGNMYDMIIKRYVLENNTSKALHYYQLMKDRGLSATASTEEVFLGLLCNDEHELDDSDKELNRKTL